MSDNDITRRDFIRYTAATAAVAAMPLAARSQGPLPFANYVRYDAMGLAELVRKGEVTPLELLETAIARAEQVNPALNAIVIRHYDLAREAIGRGLPDGPLKGVPFLLKDLYMSMAGTVTSNGSRLFRNAVADHDSTLVERYRKAGLVIFGKTASPEFGNTATTESALYGATRNPWNPAFTSGGSSGGSAVAIAAGVLPAANASDGGGSIRIPAANCGLFGLKPTRARVPMGPGRFETAGGTSVVHAITRSVRDSALLLDISRGMAPYEPYTAPPVARDYLLEAATAPGKLKVGLVRESSIGTPVHPDCLAAVDTAAALCADLGHHVEETRLRFDVQGYYQASQVLSATGTAAIVHAREKELGRTAAADELEPIVRDSVAKASAFSAEDYHRARKAYQDAGAAMAQMMREYDVLLMPTQGTPPARLGAMSLSNPDETEYVATATQASVFTMLFNASGQPAMSVPLYWNADNLPIGVQFVGAFGDEATLFRLAGQLEQARPWFDRLPVV